MNSCWQQVDVCNSTKEDIYANKSEANKVSKRDDYNAKQKNFDSIKILKLVFKISDDD